jgi:predicted phage terminase large subunit-like protein
VTDLVVPSQEIILPGSDLVIPDLDIVQTPDGVDLDEQLNHVDYTYFNTDYVPSQFAMEFVGFIKMVNGSMGEENKSPIIHYDMLDQIDAEDESLFVSFRGSAKTTALHEYMILYIATYGGTPRFGTVNVGIYVSDTIDNGVKSMRNQLQFRWENSDFLQYYIPDTRFTDVRWEFENRDKKKCCFRGFGASTGVRGFKEYGERPTWCGFDDLMSDKNAESPTITRDIKNVVYKAARQALHPAKRMQIWTGTPFNKSDPLYEAAGSGAWNTRVYPICEKFPCRREEFKGAWEDRFPYDFVAKEYAKLLKAGEISSFNQELMLRIASDEDRLVDDHDLVWYNRSKVLRNRSRYNFYITSDLGTSDGKKNDFSVIIVWAYTNNGDWLLVDGVCKRQLMDKNIDDLFKFAAIYRPLGVGIEINGQQKGFISWIKDQMITRNTFFNLTRQAGSNQEGIRRTGDKISHFKLVVPTIKAKKLWLPDEMKTHELVVELVEELRFATEEGFKSKHDDVGDAVSMLIEMQPFKPSAETTNEYVSNEEGTFAWHSDDDDDDIYQNSTVF